MAYRGDCPVEDVGIDVMSPPIVLSSVVYWLLTQWLTLIAARPKTQTGDTELGNLGEMSNTTLSLVKAGA